MGDPSRPLGCQDAVSWRDTITEKGTIMTIDELRAALAGFDGSEIVAVNTIAERNKGVWPAADTVAASQIEINGEHYRCVVLSVSDWP
jgi:hypothetical protein